MTRVVDTSVLYAFFDEDDAHFHAAREALEDATPIIVPSEVLVETAGVIKAKQDAATARACISDLLSLPHIQCSGTLDARAALAIYEATNGISLVDAFLVQHCVNHRAPALTFDERQAAVVNDKLQGP